MNSKHDLNLVISQIEEQACHANPGPAAVAAVAWLDDEFLLIPRETLPDIKHPTLDDAFGGDILARLPHVTEQTFGGDTKKMRELAFQYLVMADHIDSKRKNEEETKLKAAQFEAYKVLFPNTSHDLETFNLNSAGIAESHKNAVNEILKLKDQLAKAAQTR